MFYLFFALICSPLIYFVCFILFPTAEDTTKHHQSEEHEPEWRPFATICGNMILILYCVFLPMTRNTLNIFNCSPTDPPDGYLYMEAVFEKCWEPGGVHLSLFPYAMTSAVVYTVGIPSLFAFILFRYTSTVKEDIELFMQVGRGQLEYMSENQLEDVKRCFELLDREGVGYVSKEEIRIMLRQLGRSVSEFEFAEIMDEVDANHDGVISFVEFCAFIAIQARGVT